MKTKTKRKSPLSKYQKRMLAAGYEPKVNVKMLPTRFLLTNGKPCNEECKKELHRRGLKPVFVYGTGTKPYHHWG